MTGFIKGLVASAFLGLAFVAGGARAADEAQTPDAVVRETAQRTLAALDARREELRVNPEKIREIVDQYLLPVFDIAYAGRVVLGPHGRDATPEQRQRFVKAFYNSLVRAYGKGLLEFTSDTMRVLPYEHEEGAERARVRTQVKLDDGTTVPVDYSLRLTDEGWRVYDVTIEGISYVANYRKMVAAEISQKGLDGLIAELEAGELPAPVEKAGNEDASS
jgi:phospholipid transport system substrate-binding protein